MSTRPIVTAEELACLLHSDSAVAPARPQGGAPGEALLAQAGAALWLLKGLLLGAALHSLALQSLPTHYLWARGLLEVLCAAVFWLSLRERAHRKIAWGAALVGATTLLMDGLMLLALPG